MAPWGERDKEGQGGSIEYVLSISSSYAGYTDYNQGNTPLLILDGEKEFSNGKVLDDGIWVNASDKWKPSADGSSFESVDGDPDARFDKRSKIQQFINSAIKAGVPLEERGENALDAKMWAGLKLRVREEERNFKRDGQDQTYMQPLVIEYLGEVPTSGKASAASTAAPAASNGASDGDQLAKAKAIAQSVGPDNLIAYMDQVSRELGVGLDHMLCQESTYKSLLSA